MLTISTTTEAEAVVSYKKLWKLLIDRDLKKQDLMAMTRISTTTVTKLNKGENFNTESLVRICNAISCTSADIMKIIPDTDNK
ncbi:MAG: helix-turn-helix transcriptional regulator [Christensenellaceae bacterium]|jgi:DNA-binding Xre family transcriptional regulator|nr:helix-turn-helix transcriptional regulator [Christensenellaceae bacterium]